MRSPEVHKGRGNAWTVEGVRGLAGAGREREEEEDGREEAKREGGRRVPRSLRVLLVRAKYLSAGGPLGAGTAWGGLLRPTDSGARAPKTSRERAGATAGPKAVRAVRKRGSGGQEATGRRPAAGGRHDAAPPIGLAGSHSIGFPAWQVGACRTHPSAPSHPPDGDSPKTFGGSSPGPSAGPDFFPCDHDGAISQHQPAPKMPKKYVKLRQALGGSHSVFPRPFG